MKELEYYFKVKGYNPIVNDSSITITVKNKKYTYNYSEVPTTTDGDIYLKNNNYYLFSNGKEQKVLFWADRFEECEIKGRINLLKALPNVEWTFSKGKYDCYDATMIGKNGLNLVDIKNRNISMDTYDSAQFELGKLKNMISKQKELKANQLIFIAHYNDGYSVCWNLNKYVNNPVVVYMSPYQTVSNNTLVEKNMILLPINEGLKIKREC